MTHEDLLAAVVDHPDDDVPRLAYADFLEETGCDLARAQFIRLDVEAGRYALDHPQRAVADRAARPLYLDNWNRWVRELPANFASNGRPSFYRGFAEEVTVDAGWFASYANRLLRAAPIHTVRLRGPMPHETPYALFGGKSELYRIRKLSFELGAFDAATAIGATNGGGSWLAQPTVLDDLLSCPTLTGLSHLDLSFNNIGSRAGITLARRLAGSVFGRSLEVLNLQGCGLGDAGEAALRAAPPLPKLKSLLL
jgi:uncharacterized protein (TIGR02996 family)